MTYQDGLKKLDNRDCKKLCNNTYLIKLYEETLGVKLYSTIIIYIYSNGEYGLDTNGFRSVTTKSRINKYSPARIFQKDYKWYLYVNQNESVEFYDAMIVNQYGKVVDYSF